MLLGAPSCINGNLWEQYDEYLREKEAESKWIPSECTYAEIGIKTFKAYAEDNENLLGDLSFVYKDQYNCFCNVHHYILEDKRLTITFNATAARIEVNGEEIESNVFKADFTNPVILTFYASDGQSRDVTFTLTQQEVDTESNIPVINIAIASQTKGKEWTEATIRAVSPTSGKPDLSYTADIKLRGHNSYSISKKSYTIRSPEKISFLGMPLSKRWTLIANGSDRTLLRNRVAYELASRTALAWTPRTRHCVLLINGSYRGLYLATEQIRVGKNRVNITEMEKGDTTGIALTGGYLLEFDRYEDEKPFRTALRDIPVNIKSPNDEILSEKQQKYIENYLKQTEELIYANDSPDPSYKDYIDIASFVDVWIVLELTHCREARLPGSVWYYKDRGGKLFAGPVWDFDLTTFTNSKDFILYDYEITDFSVDERSIWYSRLFKDPEFKALAKERWQLYYPSFADIPAYIDAEAAVIKNAAAENYSLWRSISSSNSDKDLSWEEAVEKMKQSYLTRLEALNEKIMAW